jgi:hypothetical protein
MVHQKESVYTDHPLPSINLLLLLGSFFLGFLALIPIILQTTLFEGYKPLAIGILILFIAVITYAVTLIHNTYYTIHQDGIDIKYGNQVSSYVWSEFREITWKKGIFALKIGWRNITPCVRLGSALVLRRRQGPFPLFITPTDPEFFLDKIRQIYPSLQ